MTPRRRPSRFCSVAGEIVADATHPISLDVAQHLLMKFWTQAREYQRQGDFRRAAEIRRQADNLAEAKAEAERWQQCARVPFAEVRTMLKASLGNVS